MTSLFPLLLAFRSARTPILSRRHANPSLPFIAVGLKPPAHPTRDDRLFGIALGETYGARFCASWCLSWWQPGRLDVELAEMDGDEPMKMPH